MNEQTAAPEDSTDDRHPLTKIAGWHRDQKAKILEAVTEHIESHHGGDVEAGKLCPSAQHCVEDAARHGVFAEAIEEFLELADMTEQALDAAVTNAHVNAPCQRRRWQHVAVLLQCEEELARDLCTDADLDAEEPVDRDTPNSFCVAASVAKKQVARPASPLSIRPPLSSTRKH